MTRKRKSPPKPLQWGLECFGHSLLEGLAGLLPGSWLFHMGEALGGLVWHFMSLRRMMILRNLRIAFAGELDFSELQRLAKATFRRTGGNLISAAHTARLAPEKLGDVIHIENLELLEQALAGGHGVVLLLSHMGNWEILSRIVHFFPSGAKAGAFYRPLKNRKLNARVLERRQADGTRMFSKRDNPLHVAGFLRTGGIVGILADQRAGNRGEPVPFFGRLTRVSPLPSLLARRSKSTVLALAVTTEKPGKWRAVFMPVQSPFTTEHCMVALEQAMKSGPVDVFWFQERWKDYVRKHRGIRDWLGPESGCGGKPHRALLWLAGMPESWRIPEDWTHPDVGYEAALTEDQEPPAWLPASTRVHRVPAGGNCRALKKAIAAMDESAPLPLDFILVPGGEDKVLVNAAGHQAVPVIFLS